MFKDKVLLITGGTGSFGNAVLDRFLSEDIKEIRIFSRDEKKQDDMRVKYQNSKIKFYIGNTRDYNSILHATVGVDFVFQAAALKQVPSCEFFPQEATYTNVIGTSNVIKASVANGVKKVICLSTDKAAYPINAMGMTKALMEKIAIAESRNIPGDKTVICCTRYGNVMASRGSVIPLFFKQAQGSGDITVTDPNMTRFMMSLDEAVDLVLYAFKNGRQGDLFVQKSPASTVEDVAKAVKMIVNSDNEIKVIGTRHGEKLYETLLTKEEKIKAEDLGDYYRVPADNRDLNYSKYEKSGEDYSLANIVDYNSHNTRRLTLEETTQKILSLRNIKEIINGNN
ncbi:polysaccharide biosynthesis protein [uncultured Draconibacterium sp.]|uniref:polysaccharide biosynthesis protein n=1 Tax=uncultured Draconibacterium sp. TaxID=1573823 RepID=UPI0025D172D8|nr:polysaccharide biosynthesis protein [uncultured Draconibacterium sp.]